MKKLYFKKLLSLFLAGTVLVGVGCKDYDDDINDLKERVDAVEGKIKPIEDQVAAMKTTITNLEAADKALGDRITALKTNVDANAADIDALEKAQEQIKTDIANIKANYVTKDYLTTTLSSYATLDQVAKAYVSLADLKNPDSAISKAIEAARLSAIEAAGAAAEAAFQGKFDAAVAAAQLVNATKLTEEIEAYDEKIKEYLTEAVTTEDGFINKQIASMIADANTALTTELKKWVSGRMTSLLLIPESYEDGIEVIDLNTLNYIQKTVTSSATAEKFVNKTSETPWYISEYPTAIRYHVSPSVVTVDDVKAPSFLIEQVKTRAAVSKQLMQIVDENFATDVKKAWDIKSSEMTVKARRVASAKLLAAELSSGYTDFTAALQVPIADKLLQDGEAGTVIYSDYAKFEEALFDIRIAALRDDAKSVTKFSDVTGTHYHFYPNYDDNATPANNAATDNDGKHNATCAYNETIDLLTLVTGCAVDAGADTHVREIVKTKLANAGLEFRFAVPQKPFLRGANTTNQQQYIKLSGTNNAIATPVTPTGAVKNRACIDKTPVVRVELVDTKRGNAVVDACYIQLKWVEKSYEFTIPTWSYTLGCGFNSMAAPQQGFTWEQMTNLVLEKLDNGDGMSQSQFVANYKVTKITTIDTYTGRAIGNIATSADPGVEVVYNMDAAANPSVPALTWYLTTAQIGTIIDPLTGKLTTAYKDGKVMNVAVTFGRTDNTTGGEIILNFSVNIKPDPKITVNKDTKFWWHSDFNNVTITPIHINVAYPDYKTKDIGDFTTKVDYNYDLSKAFVDNKPLSGLNTCALWDIQFNKTQDVGYKPNFTSAQVYAGVPATATAGTQGYELLKNGTDALATSLEYTGMGDNWYAAAADGKTNTTNIKVTLENTVDGRNLFGNKVKTNIWGSINPQNPYLVEQFNMLYVAPLRAENELGDVEFKDVSMGQRVNCEKALVIYDFDNFLVSASVPVGLEANDENNYCDKRYAYYGVQATVWDFAAAISNYKIVNGNAVAQDVSDITVDNFDTKKAGFILADAFFQMTNGEHCLKLETNDSELVFNVVNTSINQEVIVLVPVTAQHTWGTLKTLVKVKITPRVNPSNAVGRL